MRCCPTSARRARDNQSPNLLPDGFPRSRAHPNWQSNWGQGTFIPGTQSPHLLSREGVDPAQPATQQLAGLERPWVEWYQDSPISCTLMRVAGMFLHVPGGGTGTNRFVSLAEVRSFQTWDVRKLTVLELPEGILAEPQCPGLQNGRRRAG